MSVYTTSSVGSTSSAGSTTSSTGTSNTSGLNGDDFMQLLLTELKNQDPLDRSALI